MHGSLVCCMSNYASVSFVPVQVEEYKDKVARVLADMENMRERTMRQAEREKQFAIAVRSSLFPYLL